MNSEERIAHLIQKATGATKSQRVESVQTLWSGYGTIYRYALSGGNLSTVIVKQIKPPSDKSHPRGWDTNIGHQRKLDSYRIEANWYRSWAAHCTDQCRVPSCLALHQENQETIMVLEDLDEVGFNLRPNRVNIDIIKVGLRWMANFHILFLGKKPTGLWPTGTYWHLDTRPDELERLDHKQLKISARQIDRLLKNCPFQTFVHGDAKLANFCFTEDANRVAAVDFQYVGGGVGVKDVAYFIGSCLAEADCEKYEETLLNTYFEALQKAFNANPEVHHYDYDELEFQWRRLFPIAWTDFHRFIKGWSPGHWKINGYSERLAQSVLDNL